MCKKLFILTFIIFSASALSSQEYFRSNINGMALEKTGNFKKSGNEYVLEVEKKAETVSRKLYKNGKIYKKWIQSYSPSGDLVSEIYSEGEERTETLFIQNHIHEEKFFKDNKLTVTDKYIYSPDGELSSVEKYSSSGLLLSRKEYSGGNSIVVKKAGDKEGEEKNIVSRYSFSGTDIRSEWQGNSEDTGLFYHYSSGKVIYSEKWTEGKLVSRTDYSYSGADLAETVETFFSESRLIIKKYDEKGRVLTETEKKGSSIISTVYNTYSEDNIVKKITKTDTGTEKYLYNYTDDKLTGELYYLNGSLMKKTVYQEGDGNYYEDLYSENIKYMRIYYRDNEKFKTEQ